MHPLPAIAEPLKAVEVCLPFILVEDANGEHKTLGVSRQPLAELSHRYGHAVFMRAEPKRSAKMHKRPTKNKTPDD